MRYLDFSACVHDGGTTLHVPAPCRGIVKKFTCGANADLAAAETIDIQRAGTSVNKITVGESGYTAATGGLMTGTPNATYKEYIFDPDSSTDLNQFITIVISDCDADIVFSFHIEFDDFALTTQ